MDRVWSVWPVWSLGNGSARKRKDAQKIKRVKTLTKKKVLI